MKAIKSPKLFNGTYMEYNKLLVWDDDKIVAIGDESLIAHYNITEVYTTDFTRSRLYFLLPYPYF